MRVVVACDHAGFLLKDTVIDAIHNAGHDPIDLGTYSNDSVDYADFVEKAGRVIQNNEADRGVLICGSGVGASIAANKMRGIYAAVCHDTYSSHQGVEHDNMNVICIGGRVIGPQVAGDLVQSFLKAKFIGNDPGQERHARRVWKVKKLEDENLGRQN